MSNEPVAIVGAGPSLDVSIDALAHLQGKIHGRIKCAGCMNQSIKKYRKEVEVKIIVDFLEEEGL